jgi:RHS repeat-associated protein
VKTLVGSTNTEFVFNASGQRVSTWNGATRTQLRGQYYWGSKPVAWYVPSSAVHFQHQDWLGTERLRTTYSGAVEASLTSLPFGDSQTTESGGDPYYFASLDYDSESATDHAQYRQYSGTQGRWMEPDPYLGSYDSTDPQTLNRYSYALNNPLGFTDPSGLIIQIGNCFYNGYYTNHTVLGDTPGGQIELELIGCVTLPPQNVSLSELL